VKEHHSAVVNKMQNVGNPIGRWPSFPTNKLQEKRVNL
jgi:hypothetical protein